MTLADCLYDLAQSDYYPLHMPGHKRNLSWNRDRSAPQAILSAAARLDITEIDGFDNLHAAEGILRESMERAAGLYGADQTWMSVNGSTAGLLTAVSAAVPKGGRLLMARDCHKAVYHAVCLRDIRPVYIYPDIVSGLGIADAVTPKQVERMLDSDPDVSAVLITSPTYDGITADVEAIARLSHDRGIPLIVDAAHGAHFGFHPSFPESPARLGADLTVVSLHKTLPSFTQTALLHVKGGRVDPERIRLYESIYQTSSPSYVLMAGMDECMALLEKKGQALWNDFFLERESFLKRTRKLQKLRVVTAGQMPAIQGKAADPGKILVESGKTGLTGKQIYDILLKRYHLQLEMAAGNYATAIMTCCDTGEGWNRLSAALTEIDRECDGRNRRESGLWEPERQNPYPALLQICPVGRALESKKKHCPPEEAIGQVSAGFISLYPPGIPIVAPGERLSAEAVKLISGYRRRHLPLNGVDGGRIAIMAD